MGKKSSNGAKSRGSTAAVTESYRERELSYERTRPGDLLKYSGLWIALEGETVIASNISLKQTIEQARSRGINSPYVFFVSADDTAELGL